MFARRLGCAIYPLLLFCVIPKYSHTLRVGKKYTLSHSYGQSSGILMQCDDFLSKMAWPTAGSNVQTDYASDRYARCRIEGHSCAGRHVARACATAGGKEVDGEGGQGPFQHARKTVLCPSCARSAWFWKLVRSVGLDMNMDNLCAAEQRRNMERRVTPYLRRSSAGSTRSQNISSS